MNEKSELPKRKPNRMRGFDYRTKGIYFITICTKDHRLLFGKVEEHALSSCKMILSAVGNIVDHAIREIPQHYSGIFVDHYVIMPNHVHILLRLDAGDEKQDDIPSVSTVVRHLKAYVSRKAGMQVWQKSFHDHIIRNERSYGKLWNYIEYNPEKWMDDCFYPHH